MNKYMHTHIYDFLIMVYEIVIRLDEGLYYISPGPYII